MKQIRILFYYEWLHFKAEKSLLIFTLLLMLCGCYGIFSGTTEIDKQLHKIEGLNTIYEENISEMKAKYPDGADAGDIGYYHAAFAKNIPDRWAALAIGQRDVNPAYLKIRLLAVQNQLYNSENTNPNKLAAGSFDLSFVFIFLLPLFIIAISFNVLSAEREKGTLSLLLSQPLSLMTLLTAKLLFRFVLILFLIIVLTFAGILWTGAEPDQRAWLWLLAIVLYSLFWLGTVFCVAALKKSSAFNAISLLGVWLVITIILPVAINVYAEMSRPVNEGLQLSLQQREEVHAGWDRPKEETMERFFVRYPQYSNTSTVAGSFKWKWYFAFQELGDQSVEKLYHTYTAKLLDRQGFSSALSRISVSATMQEILNGIAGTNLQQHLAFIESTRGYHDKLKAFYYPFLYHDKPFLQADFANEPQHIFLASPDWQKTGSGIRVLLLSNFLIFVLALFIYRSSKGELN